MHRKLGLYFSLVVGDLACPWLGLECAQRPVLENFNCPMCNECISVDEDFNSWTMQTS